MPKVPRTPPKLTTPNVAVIESETDNMVESPLSRDHGSEKIISSRVKRPRPTDSPQEQQTNEHVVRSETSFTAEIIDTIRVEIRKALSDEIATTIKNCVTTELSKINEHLSALPELAKSVQFMSDEFDRISAEFTVNKDKVKVLEKENGTLRKSVQELSARLNALEQFTRQENVEINGVPENNNENLIKTVVQLSNAVSNTLQEQDVLSANRVRKMDTKNNRPRSIIVRLKNTGIRDGLLASVTNFNKAHSDNKLSTHHLGYGGEKCPVFVSEHLSPSNKEIHAAVRKVAKEKAYKFVWIRDGRILVRKEEKMATKHIKCLDDVLLL